VRKVSTKKIDAEKENTRQEDLLDIEELHAGILDASHDFS
jgi:hypothetical protein